MEIQDYADLVAHRDKRVKELDLELSNLLEENLKLKKHLDMLKFSCDSLIGTSMEHPRSPKIWTIVMTPAFENLKRFLAALEEDE